MKYPILFLLALLMSVKISYAQKIELINSGDIIKQGSALHDSGQYKKALLLYNKINRSDTNYVRSLYEKALTCEADSQYKQAIKYCQEALTLKEQREDEPDIYTAYGNALNDVGESEHSLKLFDTAIAKYPSYSLLYFNKGVTLLTLNRLHEAELQFQQALLINPYMYSAHYQLGLAALKQGKVVPSFLCFMGYLLMMPDGKYAAKAIKLLSEIANNADEIAELKNKRTEQPDANYQQMEDILLSKIALDRAYKPIISLDDPISRQMQVVFEKLDYSDNNNDFYIQYYLPYYKQVYNQKEFELFVFHDFSGVNLPVVKSYVKSNKKALGNFETEAGNFFNLIRATRELQFKKRDQITERYYFDDGKLIGKGTLTSNGKSATGPWTSLYPAGNIKGLGKYNATGEREGDWIFYYRSGGVQAKEHYENGKRQGAQQYYYENGNVSSAENYVADKLDGQAITYYYSGSRRGLLNYKLDKKNGEQRSYYSNGNLELIDNYADGVITGEYKEFYKSGQLRQLQPYINGKEEGPYKKYAQNGKVIVEGITAKDYSEGEWKYYYDNGKNKEVRNYIKSVENGLHQEYYDNGQMLTTYNTKKGKIIGEADYYRKDGKVYAKYVYDDGIIKSAKFFNAAGAEINSADDVDKARNLIHYSADGLKKSHATYDKNGDLDGPDTIFYPSGKINQISQFKKNSRNGDMVSYYLNGKKKSEINMTDDDQDGYYTSYYTNGKIETEGWVKDGHNQGEWINYDEIGNISTKSFFQDGDLDGYKESFLQNGKKTLEEKYHMGWLEKMTQFDTIGKVISIDTFPKATGKYTLRYPNGKIMAQGNYINGDLDGPYKTFYFDGSVESSLFYKKGVIDSSYISYYYGGTKYSEGNYLHGDKTGTWKFYDEDGKINSSVQYVDDLLNGEKVSYVDGIKDYTSEYKDDELNGLDIDYNADGTLAYQMLFEDDGAKAFTYLGADGKLLPLIPISSNNGLVKSYFQNGKISKECIYSDGVRNGTNKLYYPNGQLSSIGNTEFGAYNGAYKEYYADGKLKTDYTYVNDNLNGVCKEYGKNGLIKKEATYINGVNNGPVKYFNENGKLIKTLWYYYGKLMAVKNEK
ncbi:tetratricopeptide repeat protein [Mucilaginibacter sp. X4EP1]|uniref:tetratricopeptide repeat protein n=1 Tax=Mucilaginibacter sp. X4EP1 TaxID=2723092 RepID=UPI00216812B1|nr:tetratricopeptide repeat protein [Mucilaginibacter sp. X4EP1]MCS3811654.1 antitoxin component YwqK of YwqJK toxin-antitoxin module [Mucilaginibacter sp. X4EP1]